MRVFIIALLAAISYAQTEENPWTCRNTEQNKFSINDLNTQEDVLKECLTPIYEANVGPNEKQRICDGGQCFFEGCCWDKAASTTGLVCANPDANVAVTDVNINMKGCQFRCERSAYGARGDSEKKWDNEVMLTIERYEVIDGKSESKAKFKWKDVGVTKADITCRITSTHDITSCSEDSVKSAILQMDVKEWDCGLCDLDGASRLRKACCESCGNLIKTEGLNQDMRYLICKNCPEFPYPTDYSQIADKMRSYVQTAVVNLQGSTVLSTWSEDPAKSFKGLLKYDVVINETSTMTSQETCVANVTNRIPFKEQRINVRWGVCTRCDEENQKSCCEGCSSKADQNSYLVCHGCDKKELQNGRGYLDDAVTQIVNYYSGRVTATAKTGKSSSLPLFITFVLLLLSLL